MPHNDTAGKPSVRTRGFTLIELMVAMAIGTIVMFAAISLFRTSLAQNRSDTYSSQLQNEAFFISHVLKQQISQIGYRPIDQTAIYGRILPIADRQKAFPEQPGSWEAGQTISVTDNTLSYRFHGASTVDMTADFSIYDCLGNPMTSGVVQTNQISLIDEQLVCVTDSGSSVILGSVQGVLIERIEYGLGVDDDGDNVVDRTVNASVATTADFINTKQLNARLLLVTPDQVASDNLNYYFNEIEYMSDDRKLRRETEVSMMLRNS